MLIRCGRVGRRGAVAYKVVGRERTAPDAGLLILLGQAVEVVVGILVRAAIEVRFRQDVAGEIVGVSEAGIKAPGAGVDDQVSSFRILYFRVSVVPFAFCGRDEVAVGS